MRLGNRSEGGRRSRSHGDGTFRRFRRAGLGGSGGGRWPGSRGLRPRRPRRRPRPSSASRRRQRLGHDSSGLSISSFTVDIASTMSQFKPLTAVRDQGSHQPAGRGDPARHHVVDAVRRLRRAVPERRLHRRRVHPGAVPDRQRAGQRRDRADDATADINLGAKVLIVDPLDGPTGVAIAKLAESKGVTLIAYDRAIFQGTSTYYVSFNNELVGELIGQGFEACVKAWKHLQAPGLRPERRRGHRPQRHLLRRGLQQGGLGPGGQDSRRRRDQQPRLLAGRRELRPRVGQHQGRHDLPAGVHRSPEDQRHHRGQ